MVQAIMLISVTDIIRETTWYGVYHRICGRLGFRELLRDILIDLIIFVTVNLIDVFFLF